MRQGDAVTYLHTDHLGTVSVATSSNGQFIARTLNLPYGGVRWTDGTMPTDWGYTGQKEPIGTGLVYLHARFYAPWAGRFVSADTVVPGAGSSQAWNRYAYTHNNPLKYTDPSGHCIGPLLLACVYIAEAIFAVGAAAEAAAPAILVGAAILSIPSDTPNPNLPPASGPSPFEAAVFGLGFVQAAASGVNATGIFINRPQAGFVMRPVESKYSEILEKESHQAALDYTVKRYGIKFPATTVEGPAYDPKLTSFGRTTPLGNGTTRVTIGPSAFSSEAQLASTLGHECVHCVQRAQEAADLISYDWAGWEMQAWRWELENAGITGLSAAERADAIKMWQSWTNLWRSHHGIE